MTLLNRIRPDGRFPRWPGQLAAALLLSAIIVTGAASDTQAAKRPQHGAAGTVVACSTYGHGCVRGAVRQGRVEQEVQMPGGTWIGCKRDCRQTLREEALDFFETLRDRVWDR